MSAGLAERQPAPGPGTRHAVRPLSRTSGWAPTLLLAWRDVRAHTTRTVLTVLLLALPVAVASGIVVVAATSDTTLQESLRGQLGSATGLVVDTTIDGPVVQDVSGYGELPGSEPVTGVLRDPLTAEQVTALLPPGSTVLPLRLTDAFLAPQGWDGDPERMQRLLPAMALDTSAAVTAGMFDVLSGRLPQASAEVALTPGAARLADADVGDTVQVSTDQDGAGPADAFPMEVVGIAVRQGTAATTVAATALPAQLGVDGSSGREEWLVDSPTALEPEDLQRLNAAGLTLLSPQTVADPPESVVAYDEPAINEASALAAVAVLLVLLQIVLLAGPAFAVSVRQQRAEFALLAATGADRRALRRVVLSGAAAIGLGAAAAGLLIGVGGTALALRYSRQWLPIALGPFDAPLGLLAGVLVLALATAVAAAWWPARTASRTDTTRVLAGRRGVTAVPWRRGATGAVVLVVGAALSWFGAAGTGASAVVIAGVFLSVVGTLLVVPLLVAGLEPVSRTLPLPLRLAARDTSRAAGRSIAAVVAVAGVTGGLVAASTWALSGLQFATDRYEPQLAQNSTTASLITEGTDRADLASLQSALPQGFTVALAGSLVAEGDGTTQTVTIQTPGCATPGGLDATAEGVQCQLATAATEIAVTVGPDAAPGLGYPLDAEERAHLEAGGALVLPPYDALIDQGRLALTPTTATGEQDPRDETVVELDPTVDVPARAYARPDLAEPASLLMAPATAASLGVTPVPTLGIVTGPRALTSEEEAALGATNGVFEVYTERGFQLDWAEQGLPAAGLLTAALVAVVVATLLASGLALTDARATFKVLANVGARSRTQRVVAGATTTVIAATGGLAGTFMGLGPGLGLARLTTGSYFDPEAPSDIAGELGGYVQVEPTIVLPWTVVLVIVCLLPLLLGAVTAALARTGRRTARAV